MIIIYKVYKFIFEILGGSSKNVKHEHWRIIFMIFQVVFFWSYVITSFVIFLITSYQNKVVKGEINALLYFFFVLVGVIITLFINNETKKERFVNMVMQNADFKKNIFLKRVYFYVIYLSLAIIGALLGIYFSKNSL